MGRRLLGAAIEAFHRLGGGELFLSIQQGLKPALARYRSTGFERQPQPDSHDQRSDVCT